MERLLGCTDIQDKPKADVNKNFSLKENLIIKLENEQNTANATRESHESRCATQAAVKHDSKEETSPLSVFKADQTDLNYRSNSLLNGLDGKIFQTGSTVAKTRLERKSDETREVVKLICKVILEEGEEDSADSRIEQSTTPSVNAQNKGVDCSWREENVLRAAEKVLKKILDAVKHLDGEKNETNSVSPKSNGRKMGQKILNSSSTVLKKTVTKKECRNASLHRTEAFLSTCKGDNKSRGSEKKTWMKVHNGTKTPKKEVKQTIESAKVSQLLRMCTGEKKLVQDFCIAELDTPGVIGSYKDAKNIIIHVFNVKPFEFAGLSRAQNERKFSFLISNEALRKCLSNNPHPEAGRLVPWSSQDLEQRHILATIIASQIVNNGSPNKGLKNAAKHLLQLLSSHDAGSPAEFIYDCLARESQELL